MMLTPDNFTCRHCGECCRAYTVKLSGKDIRRIEKAGYQKGFFAEPDYFDIKKGRYALRRINGQCIFLTEKDNKAWCRIYQYRPDICREYPFNETQSVAGCSPKKELR